MFTAISKNTTNTHILSQITSSTHCLLSEVLTGNWSHISPEATYVDVFSKHNRLSTMAGHLLPRWFSSSSSPISQQEKIVHMCVGGDIAKCGSNTSGHHGCNTLGHPPISMVVTTEISEIPSGRCHFQDHTTVLALHLSMLCSPRNPNDFYLFKIDIRTSFRRTWIWRYVF